MKELTGVPHLAVVVPRDKTRPATAVPADTPTAKVLEMLRRSRGAATEEAKRIARRNRWLAHAKAVTGRLGIAMLELHSPSDDDYCVGCECVCSPEPWPCATVVVLAQAVGLDQPEA